MPQSQPASVRDGLRSCTASDVLDSITPGGLHRQCLWATIEPLVPGVRAVGYAATLQFEAARETCSEPYENVIEFIDGLQPGDVVVLAAGGSGRSAVWGELFTAAAIGRGAVGVITDGMVRDFQEILAQKLPVFARGVLPLDLSGRMRAVNSLQPVLVGGVWIEPGDLIVADDDGIVVVPRSFASAVIEGAAAKSAVENQALGDLRGGASLRTIWERHHVL